MQWSEHYARAVEVGHNWFRLPSWQLGRFAHAYADLVEEEPWWTVTQFHDAWDSGEFAPDSIGRYHHRAWFDGVEKRVA